MLYSSTDATAVEHVVLFEDSAAAENAAQVLASDFGNCSTGDPAEVRVQDRDPQTLPAVRGADQTLHASRLSTPVQASEVNYFELGLARKANVLVVVQFTGGPIDGVDWVWDSQRLGTALGRAVG
jgi:hypothetical protein